MGYLSHFLYPWGLLLQGLAIIHFIRRRPDTYWIYVVLFLGPLGAMMYLLAEALPDIGLLGQSSRFFPAASALAYSKLRFEITPRQGIMKSSAISISMTASFSWREPHSIRPLRRVPIRLIPFTGAAFAPSS